MKKKKTTIYMLCNFGKCICILSFCTSNYKHSNNYWKYSHNEGGSTLKYDDLCDLYKHVLAFVKSTQTEYIFPIGDSPIFRFLLKGFLHIFFNIFLRLPKEHL